MNIRCWFHTTYVSDDGADWRPGAVVSHDFTGEQTERLLELFSHGDWEDGPRCLLDVLARDQQEDLVPILWLRSELPATP